MPTLWGKATRCDSKSKLPALQTLARQSAAALCIGGDLAGHGQFRRRWAAPGSQLEFTQGRWRILLGYLVSVGASGGVAGLISMELARILRFRKDFPNELSKRVGKSLAVVLVINALLLVVPFIDGADHVGGFPGGLVLMFP